MFSLFLGILSTRVLYPFEMPGASYIRDASGEGFSPTVPHTSPRSAQVEGFNTPIYSMRLPYPVTLAISINPEPTCSRLCKMPSWTHLIRFIAVEDSQVHLGQLVDTSRDIGKDSTNGVQIAAYLIQGTIYDGRVTGEIMHVQQVST